MYGSQCWAVDSVGHSLSVCSFPFGPSKGRPLPLQSFVLLVWSECSYQLCTWNVCRVVSEGYQPLGRPQRLPGLVLWVGRCSAVSVVGVPCIFSGSCASSVCHAGVGCRCSRRCCPEVHEAVCHACPLLLHGVRVSMLCWVWWWGSFVTANVFTSRLGSCA